MTPEPNPPQPVYEELVVGLEDGLPVILTVPPPPSIQVDVELLVATDQVSTPYFEVHAKNGVVRYRKGTWHGVRGAIDCVLESWEPRD